MSTDVRSDILAKLKTSFPCTSRYESEVMLILGIHLEKAHDLNRHSMKAIMRGILNKFQKPQQVESKVMFNAVFVYIKIQQTTPTDKENQNSFHRRYPEFVGLSDKMECAALMQFRRVFLVAMLILDPAKGKKDFFLLVDRICGGMHITGVGQTLETDRRVLIYERETGIPFRKPQVPSRQGSIEEKTPLAAPVSIATTPVATTTPVVTITTAISTPPQDTHIVVTPHTIDSAEDTDDSNERRRVHEYSKVHKKMRLAEGRAFWLHRARLMQCGTDIPYLLVAPHEASAAFAYPSHDWGQVYPPHRQAPPPPRAPPYLPLASSPPLPPSTQSFNSDVAQDASTRHNAPSTHPLMQ